MASVALSAGGLVATQPRRYGFQATGKPHHGQAPCRRPPGSTTTREGRQCGRPYWHSRAFMTVPALARSRTSPPPPGGTPAPSDRPPPDTYLVTVRPQPRLWRAAWAGHSRHSEHSLAGPARGRQALPQPDPCGSSPPLRARRTADLGPGRTLQDQATAGKPPYLSLKLSRTRRQPTRCRQRSRRMHRIGHRRAAQTDGHGGSFVPLEVSNGRHEHTRLWVWRWM